MPSSIEPTRRATERCRSLGTTEPAGSWVLAGAWAGPGSTSRAASIEVASQRDERLIDEFMLGVSLADDDPYNSKVRPCDGPLQVVKDKRFAHAPAGCSLGNRDGFDSLHRGRAIDDRDRIPAAPGICRSSGRRAGAIEGCLRAVRDSRRGCHDQLLRGIAHAPLAPWGPRGADADACDRPVDLLAEEMSRRDILI